MSEVTPVMPKVAFGMEPMDDLEERIAALHATGERVVPVNWMDGTAWLAIAYDDALKCATDEENFSGATFYEKFAAPSQGRSMQSMTGREHRSNCGLVYPSFVQAMIRKLTESWLVSLANELVDQFGSQRDLDLVASFTRQYPFRVQSRLR